MEEDYQRLNLLEFKQNARQQIHLNNNKIKQDRLGQILQHITTDITTIEHDTNTRKNA